MVFIRGYGTITGLAYILDGAGGETVFYRLSGGVYVPIPPQDGVIRSTILPGFQFRLADLYRLPEPPALIEDPIYQRFVSPFLRAERIRVEQESQRAEQAEARLLREQARAERYAALLKEQGISVEDPD